MLWQTDHDFGTPQQLQLIRLVSRKAMTQLRAARGSTEERSKVSEPFLGALECGTKYCCNTHNNQPGIKKQANQANQANSNHTAFVRIRQFDAKLADSHSAQPHIAVQSLHCKVWQCQNSHNCIAEANALRRSPIGRADEPAV